MNDYDVTFVADLFSIYTTISANDEEEAARFAFDKLYTEENVNMWHHKFNETRVEKVGEWAR
jgi:hypothetical protein